MKLKYIVLGAIVFGLLFAPSCANPCKDIKKYWKPIGADFSIFEAERQLRTDTTDFSVSRSLQFVFDLQYKGSNSIAVNQYGFHNAFGLINSAYAYSCPSDGYMGISDSVVSIAITTISKFDSFEVGENLYPYAFNIDSTTLVEYGINDASPANPKAFNLFLYKGSEQIEMHRFTMKMMLKSGDSISVSSDTIFWN